MKPLCLKKMELNPAHYFTVYFLSFGIPRWRDLEKPIPSTSPAPHNVQWQAAREMCLSYLTWECLTHGLQGKKTQRSLFIRFPADSKWEALQVPRGEGMQRGLAGSEQGIAPKRNSAGTWQPLMYRERIGFVPNTTNWQVGIKQVLWGSRKYCGRGCRLPGRMGAAWASSVLGAHPAHNAELDRVQLPMPQLWARCQGGTDRSQGCLQKSYGHDENKEG